MSRFLAYSGRLLLVLLLSVAITACGAKGGAGQAQKVVNAFLAAGQAGDIEAAYALVINMSFGDKQLLNGPAFLDKIAGPAATAAESKKKLGETLKANYEKVQRQVKGVERDSGVTAEQYWVTVEEANAENKVGEIRYLLVQTDAGWRMDMARSNFSKALGAEK